MATTNQPGMAENQGKEDGLRRGIKQTLTTIGKVTTQFNNRYHLGPSQTEVTSKQVRLAYQNMDAITKLKEMDQMGPEQWDAHMDRLYNG